MPRMQPRLWIAVFLLALAAVPPARGDDGWWSGLFRRQPVSLVKVLESPEAFRGQSLSIQVQLHGPAQLENPYFTKFDAMSWHSFAVWADEAPLWEREAFKADFPFLFVRRGTKEAETLLAAAPYSRWIVTGKVAEVLKGQPWIEVQGVRRLEEQLTETVLISIVKALQLRDLRRFDAAAAEFRGADQRGVPAAIRAMVMREEALALHAAGKTEPAIQRLLDALRVKDEPTTRAVLAMCREAIGLAPDGTPRGRRAADAPPGAAGER